MQAKLVIVPIDGEKGIMIYQICQGVYIIIPSFAPVGCSQQPVGAILSLHGEKSSFLCGRDTIGRYEYLFLHSRYHKILCIVNR